MIKQTLITHREFLTWQEFENYCIDMKEAGAIHPAFWDQMKKDHKGFCATEEPANRTIIVTEGKVWEEE